MNLSRPTEVEVTLCGIKMFKGFLRIGKDGGCTDKSLRFKKIKSSEK